MNKINRFTQLVIMFAALLSFTYAFTYSAVAAMPKTVSKGQTVYVPIYSHIYSGDRERPYNLTSTMSIRNTDLNNKITVLSVTYYNSEGTVISENLPEVRVLAPLSTTRFVVKESDTSGGSGASFLIKWKADKEVSSPIIEAIMISTRSQQGLSFTSRGQVVEEW